MHQVLSKERSPGPHGMGNTPRPQASCKVWSLAGTLEGKGALDMHGTDPQADKKPPKDIGHIF